MVPGDQVWVFLWDDELGQRRLVKGEFVCRREHPGCVPARDFKVLIDGQLEAVTAIYLTARAAQESEGWT